jgi:hypothetical protein
LRDAATPSGQWSLVSIGFMNDATNSNIWRRKKLNVCDVKVQWISNFDALVTRDFTNAVNTRRCTCPGFSLGWGAIACHRLPYP